MREVTAGGRWLDVAILVALVALVAGLAWGAVAYEGARRAERQTIDLVAHTPMAGGWSLGEIRVHRGDVVRLRLTSEDVTHGFLIPDLGISAEPIVPGSYQVISFIADRAGTFTFYCNVLCSDHHGAMIGRLVVED